LSVYELLPANLKDFPTPTSTSTAAQVHLTQLKLITTIHSVQTIIKDVLVCNIKLVHNIEIRLIIKVLPVTELSKVALFHILQIGKEEKSSDTDPDQLQHAN